MRGKHYDKFFAHMYGNQPDAWDDELDGYKRLRVITNALTRMRVCTLEGAMEFKFKGEQHKIPAGYIPWFDVPHRASRSTSVIFGHWSALGSVVSRRYHRFGYRLSVGRAAHGDTAGG